MAALAGDWTLNQVGYNQYTDVVAARMEQNHPRCRLEQKAARMGQHVPGALGRRVFQPRRQKQAARQGHVVQALAPSTDSVLAGRKSRSSQDPRVCGAVAEPRRGWLRMKL